MPISEQIREIIDRRKGRGEMYAGKGHLQAVEAKINFYNNLKTHLTNFSVFREKVIRQMSEKTGDYYQISLEDPLFEQKINAISPDLTLCLVNEALEQLERMQIRFNRESINISVVGQARQGKSLLLQSISGVSNDVIPASDGKDCTGAKSVISNKKGVLNAYADVYFYSEVEMVGHVSKYLTEIGISRKLGSFNDIPNLKDDLDSINVTTLTATQQSLMVHLKKYVEHFNDVFDDKHNLVSKGYSDLVAQRVKRNVPKDEIRFYVAQKDSNNKPTYAFLAVKEVRIFNEFPCSDAENIVLVDTIGLGDTSLGIKEKMIDTLRNESDAAILVRLPNPVADHLDKKDDELYDFISDNLGIEVLDNWLFFALNVWDVNRNSGEVLEEEFKTRAWKYAFLKSVNCAKEEDVREKLLVPVLEHLASNLAAVDNNLMIETNKKLGKCYDEYSDLCAKVHALSDSSFKKALDSGGLFDELFEDELKLTSELDALNSKYKTLSEAKVQKDGQEEESAKCSELEEDIDNTLGMISSICPSTEFILSQLNAGTANAHPSIVYQVMSDHCRASICDKFEDVNETTISKLENDFKNAIVEILRSEKGGKLGLISINSDSDNLGNIEWLGVFVSQKLQDFPCVKKAFSSILDYKINIEGLLEYKVNRSLKYLDPEESEFEHNIDFTSAKDRNEQAEMIEQGILSAINAMAFKLSGIIQELLQIPYNSFYARIRKFREQLIYSKEGYRELKNMYRKFATYIWKDKFASIATRSVAIKELSDYIENFDENNVKNKFVVKIQEENVNN